MKWVTVFCCNLHVPMDCKTVSGANSVNNVCRSFSLTSLSLALSSQVLPRLSGHRLQSKPSPLSTDSQSNQTDCVAIS